MIFLKAQDLFSPEHTLARELFAPDALPWGPLGAISGFILRAGPFLGGGFRCHGEGIWIADDAVIAPSVSISGPCIIDHGAEVRHGAFIRGRAVIGKGCVVGNSTEIKNSILFDGAQAPHFNYVGDSILGHRAHIGAGVITGNVKCDRRDVIVHIPGSDIPTGLRKLGALIGDNAEIGCGTVLCPGATVGRRAIIYPMSCVRGHVPKDHIYKSAGNVVRRQDGEC